MFCSKFLVFIVGCLTVSHLQGLDPFACLQRDVKGGAAILSYKQQAWVHRILGKLIVFCFNPQKIAPFLAPAKYFRYRDRKIMKNLVYTPIAPRYQLQLKRKHASFKLSVIPNHTKICAENQFKIFPARQQEFKQAPDSLRVEQQTSRHPNIYII